jgi:hypothetical protein
VGYRVGLSERNGKVFSDPTCVTLNAASLQASHDPLNGKNSAIAFPRSLNATRVMWSGEVMLIDEIDETRQV